MCENDNIQCEWKYQGESGDLWKQILYLLAHLKKQELRISDKVLALRSCGLPPESS